MPLIVGLCQVATTAEDIGGEKVWLSGWRSSERETRIDQYFYVSNRDVIELRKSIEKLGDILSKLPKVGS